MDNKLKTKLAVSEYGKTLLLQVVRQQHEISHFREMAEDLAGFAIVGKGSAARALPSYRARR